MAGDSIRMEHALTEKPEFLELMARTGMSEADVFFALFRLWTFFDVNTEDGLASGISREALALRCKAPPSFIDVLASESVRWLEWRDGNPWIDIRKIASRYGTTRKRINSRRKSKEEWEKNTKRTTQGRPSSSGRSTKAPPHDLTTSRPHDLKTPSESPPLPPNEASPRTSPPEGDPTNPTPEQLAYPPGFDTPRVRTAVRKFIAHRAKHDTPSWHASTWQAQLEHFAPLGPEAFVEAVGYAIRQQLLRLQAAPRAGPAKPSLAATVHPGTFDDGF